MCRNDSEADGLRQDAFLDYLRARNSMTPERRPPCRGLSGDVPPSHRPKKVLKLSTALQASAAGQASACSRRRGNSDRTTRCKRFLPAERTARPDQQQTLELYFFEGNGLQEIAYRGDRPSAMCITRTLMSRFAPFLPVVLYVIESTSLSRFGAKNGCRLTSSLATRSWTRVSLRLALVCWQDAPTAGKWVSRNAGCPST
jgi:hypothetical protein